jgi:hypothetical protein
LAAYRITARSLERQLVGDKVLNEFASLDDVARGKEALPSPKAKVVLVLEEDDESPLSGAPRRPQ